MLPGELAHALGGAVIDDAGFGVMATLWLDVDEQPFAVTVTASVVVPEAPEVKVTELVSVLLVIAPLVLVQAYVAPAIGVTLAVRPAVFGHVDVGALIVEEGFAVIVAVCVPLLVQPLTVTVTPTTTLPLEPAVMPTLLPLGEVVIVPLVMLQL